ncbi:MAG TPA: hypothetical protein VNC50_11100 [Planctomycetia bacterium]|nr:hypothetical protein [Planctomycetia bacterium]
MIPLIRKKNGPARELALVMYDAGIEDEDGDHYTAKFDLRDPEDWETIVATIEFENLQVKSVNAAKKSVTIIAKRKAGHTPPDDEIGLGTITVTHTDPDDGTTTTVTGIGGIGEP